MQKQTPQELANFDFLARSFARMQSLGQPVDIRAVTGNMSEQQGAWFRERYEHYRTQAVRAKEQTLEVC
ncbi:glycogen synthesis protein GlgS [Kluyvera genomosp. 1]|uniref:glycogen synthesis protein GlgS n=1 Tax=Kluyvera genomosp. 1 TaxID=2774053 RepID=UPI00068FD9AB|nr:glycogen synthesis protein GlgS [Kluyvera genomosp. 1]